MRDRPRNQVLAWAVMSTAFSVMSVAGCAPSLVVAECADSIACQPTQFCQFGANACGRDRSRGACTERPSPCPPDVETVCGCDGVTYDNACRAQTAGADVARSGSCEAPCAPDDAHASGTCDLSLGWYWDGLTCRALSGCLCHGVDCDDRSAALVECEALHALCGASRSDANAPDGGIPVPPRAP